MLRTFHTHQVRKQTELTGCYWDFTPCTGELKEQTFNVLTPSCWESYPDFSNYRGECIYKTTFYAEGTIRLEFKGISHTATVYVDGKEVASHYNAYTIFSTIVENLSCGNHTLEIKVDNQFSENSALHIPNDYMTYGGIIRPVIMECLASAYIHWVHVTPFMENNIWRTKVEVKVENISPDDLTLDIETEIEDQKVSWTNTYLKEKQTCILEQEMSFNTVNPWTVENPTLYFVHATLIQNGQKIDDMIDRFGFREVKLEGTKILLNNRSVLIKGLCRHEDHPQFGCSLPYEVMAADIAIIKHLGANSIRTSHYPNDELFLDLCDEQGILVWEENHARGLSLEDMQNPNFEKQAEQVISEMIPAHYNHPSIYIWGILNECASETEYGKACYQKQFELIKKLDTSRPHSFASCKFKTDVSFGLPDVVSYNIYPLWYHDTPVDEYLDDLYKWIQKETEGANKPFLISEIGAGAIYGYRNNHHGKWTEEYQATALRKQLEAVLSYAACSGVYIWQFCDIRVSEEWFEKRPRCMNNKGIVDEYRRRKLSYDVVKNIFETY